MPISVDAFPFFETTALIHGAWIDGVGSYSQLTNYGYSSSWRALAYKSILPVAELSQPDAFRAIITTSLSPFSSDWSWALGLSASNGTTWKHFGSLPGSDEVYSGSDLTHEYILFPDYSGGWLGLPPGWPDNYHWFVIFTFRDMGWGMESYVDWPAPTAFDGMWTSESLGPPPVADPIWTSYIGTREVAR